MHNEQSKAILEEFQTIAASLNQQVSFLPQKTLDLPCETFFRNDFGRITLRGHENLNKMNRFVETLWEAESKIQQTISCSVVRDKVIDLFFRYLRDESSITEESFQDVLTELVNIPKCEWQVICPVRGAYLEHSETFHLGPFTLYSWQEYEKVISSKDPDIMDLMLQDEKEIRRIDKAYSANSSALEDLGSIFISTKVSARDKQRAFELAINKFIQFENVISYMLGHDAKNYDFGIVDYSSRNIESMMLSYQFISYRVEVQQKYFPLQLDAAYFAGRSVSSADSSSYFLVWEDVGHSWIWETIERDMSQRSEWHGRILSAIDWIGRGAREVNTANSLVQYVFAIENLFHKRGGGTSERLRRYTAFIIASKIEEQEIIKDKVKKIYQERCNVVHEGSQNIPSRLASEALTLVKELTKEIILDPNYINMGSFRDLEKFFENR